MTSSNGIIFSVTGPLCGEFTCPGEFPAQRPATRSFDVFFDLCLNKRLRKQPWSWWFETPSKSLWRQCNANCTAYMRERDSFLGVNSKRGKPGTVPVFWSWSETYFIPKSRESTIANTLLLSYQIVLKFCTGCRNDIVVLCGKYQKHLRIERVLRYEDEFWIDIQYWMYCSLAAIATCKTPHMIYINIITWIHKGFVMKTSSNRNISRVTGHLCGDFTGLRWIPCTKASDAEL